MRQFFKKSGFTLLEIVIVIIIIGVLAGLALPRFFSTIEYSRSIEALVNLASVRQGMERCYIQRKSYKTCTTFEMLALDDPSKTPNSFFSYQILNLTNNGYRLVATRNTIDGGSGIDTISLIQDNVTGKITREGTSAFKGIQ